VPIAIPLALLTRRIEDRIRQGELWHFTSPARLNEIATGLREGAGFGTHQVRLVAGSGWSPGRLLRDYSVLDLNPFNLRGDPDYGRYLYFFLGEPGLWGRLKNLPRGDFAIVKIRAADILTSGVAAFYRFDDQAVVVGRGEFTGPALIELRSQR
jgi:hypothetical protein